MTRFIKKRCSKCRRDLPLAGYFKRVYTDEYMAHCKQCELDRRDKILDRTLRPSLAERVKRCLKGQR